VALAQLGKRGIPRVVWMLGFVSLSMDLSSELIHSLLPIYLVGTLGVSASAVGLIEGVAESTALIVKIFSGAISDYIGRRKGLLLLGYGLAALTKPLFPLAQSATLVIVARFLDRVGKGIRGAPRDALVADVAPPAIRGACFGLRQSMDTIGAFLGPILAILLMLWLGNIQHVLWFAVIPAALTILLILLGVDEPAHEAAEMAESSSPKTRHFRAPIRWQVLRDFPAAYWWVVLVGGVFSLARFSEAFLVLAAQRAGLSPTWVPLIMVVMSLLYTLSAYPAGILSDRLDRSLMLMIGLVLLIAGDILLAQPNSITLMFCGVILWGLHMGFTQGILAAMIADTTPASLKGTAFGLFNLVSGLALLLSSVIAGWLWQYHGPATTFIAGAGFAGLTLLLMLIRLKPRQSRS
jgi:MFS family permease